MYFVPMKTRIISAILLHCCRQVNVSPAEIMMRWARVNHKNVKPRFLFSVYFYFNGLMYVITWSSGEKNRIDLDHAFELYVTYMSKVQNSILWHLS